MTLLVAGRTCRRDRRRQARILRALAGAAARGGHHFGAYSTAAPDPEGEVPVYVHAKLLAIDDRFLLVSSANLTHRSMGLDTARGVAARDEPP